MKINSAWAAVVCGALLVLTRSAYASDSAPKSASKIRVLVVTGGHGFEKGPFFKLFEENPGIAFQAVEHPDAHARLRPEAAKGWDVLVLYDLHQEISDEAKADLVARLKDGKGLVVLHHAIADYQAWPEYTGIIGAHYYLSATNVNGIAKPRSAWKEGMKFRIHVIDPNHPVTRGMIDFDTHDETYKGFDMVGACQPLLSTEEPRSNHVIAWCKSYEGARVVYIQSGHDHFAYENPNYQQLLRQAIRWTARLD